MISTHRQSGTTTGHREKSKKLAEASKAAAGNLDFIDELPDAPKRWKIPFPYDSTDKPRPRPIDWNDWQ